MYQKFYFAFAVTALAVLPGAVPSHAGAGFALHDVNGPADGKSLLRLVSKRQTSQTVTGPGFPSGSKPFTGPGRPSGGQPVYTGPGYPFGGRPFTGPGRPSKEQPVYTGPGFPSGGKPIPKQHHPFGKQKVTGDV